MGRTRPILGIVCYVVELNIRGKFQGRSSRASYISQVRDFGIFNVFAHIWGGLHAPAKPLGLKFLQRYILRPALYQPGKFWFSASLLLDIWNRRYRVRGISHSRKIHIRCVLVPSMCGQNLVPIGWGKGNFWPKNRNPDCPQWKPLL